MNLTYKLIVITLLIAIASLVGIGYLIINDRVEMENAGSVGVSDEYQATTTASMTAGLNQFIASSTSGIVLGSVVVASSSTGSMRIYNATSSDAVAAGAFSVLLAKIPTGTPEGTYTFDIQMNQGLVITLDEGFGGDYVITYRR